MKQKLHVTALASGTVIDHLAPGTAFRALRLLDIPSDATVLIGVNLPSQKHGKKDLIKVAGRELGPRAIDRLALLATTATLSIIRDYAVVEKIRPRLPEVVEGLLRCANPACISRDARVATRFVTESSDPLTVRCFFCERSFSKDEIEFA